MRESIFYTFIILFTFSTHSFASETLSPKWPQGKAFEEYSTDDARNMNAFLTLLQLKQQGLVGGNSGICIDYIKPKNGGSGPKFRIGLATDAFQVKSSELAPEQKAQMQNLKKLMKKMHSYVERNSLGSDDVRVDINGFADGQGLRNDPKDTVEMSIANNKNLALNRAKTVGNFVLGQEWNAYSDRVNYQGHASPLAETDAKANGLKKDCPKRRRVVINIGIGSGQTYFGEKRDNFTPKYKIAENNLQFNLETEANVRAAKLFLKDNGTLRPLNAALAKLPKSCRTEMVRDYLGYIEHFLERASNHDKNQLLNRDVKHFIVPFDKEIDQDGIGHKIKQSLLDEKHAVGPRGRTVMRENWMAQEMIPKSCFDVSETLSAHIKFSQKSNTQPVREIKRDEQGNIEIGFKEPETQTVLSTYLRGEPVEKNASGEYKTPVKGFMCIACGAGIHYHNGQFQHSYIAHGRGDSAKVLPKLVKTSQEFENGIGKSSKTYYGNIVKPQNWIINNCAGCNCDLGARIKNKDFQVVMTEPKAQKVKADDDQCIYTPPIAASCSVSPKGLSEGNKAKAQKMLKWKDLDGALHILNASVANKLEDEIVDMAQSWGCNVKSIGSGENNLQNMVNSVSCSPMGLELPSADNNEKSDCTTID